ncbi:hypothetical protein GLOIN_2v1876500 [Rhizophagus irregularis DAOM 181602=DAOM 197198]|nr:hypothetical protein GLOIN_2v1876500 [Rhizophagus irregularis DAOM 181602=DAOM 197198]
MEGSSSQSGNSSTNTASGSLENNDPVSYKTILYENMSNNRILLKLEEDEFITPDEKVEELLKNLTKPSYLYALKLLFENLQNEFSSQVLENSLEALVDTSFKHYSKESVARLELHLRILVTVLERICFSPIVLSKELRDKVYNSLAKFAEIHRKTTQEAIDLNPKRSVAYFICGEIFFRQNDYGEAIYNLKETNYLERSIIYKAKINNSYILLGNSYLLRGHYADYDDPLNSSAYYLKSLTYYTKNDNNNAKVSFKKYAELLNSDNDLAKVHLFYLEYLLNNNSSKDLNDILTKIDQIHNYSSFEYEFLQFIKCKIYIELKEYSKARLALNNIWNFVFISYIIQEHPDFWSYLYEVCEINKNDFTEFGIVDEFSKYMYEEHDVYFVSILTNLNSELCQFQESDISSLSGLVLSSKNGNLRLVLPMLKNYKNYLICKMNVKKILSKDCFIKFIINDNYQDCMLKHKDVSKLEGLGWIEYQISEYRPLDVQLSIEINSIEMQIEYIRFGSNPRKVAYIPDMITQLYSK